MRSTILLILPIIASLQLRAVFACPFQVRAFCACIEQLDGVQLNCTAPTARQQNGTTTTNNEAMNNNNNNARKYQFHQHSQDGAIQLMQILRNSQTQLGLLKVLTIHGTSIPVLANNFFAGLFIRRLELVNCGIAVIEKSAFGGLEHVIQELAITGNRIDQMPTPALAGLSSLVRLDLSNNSIGELKSEHALPRLPKLNDINLSHNQIVDLHKTFFDGVKGTLQTINLGHNLIAEVPASALRGFRMLMALHLHNNQLGSLAALSFMNLPVLGLLNLAQNRIQQIHRQAFLNAPMLRFLYLSGNKLTRIQPYQLSSFEHLEMLDLSNNWLETLDNDSFSGLPSLRQLYLGENHISRIEPHAFSQNSSIAVLIMEQNWMVEVQKDTFHALRQLQQLSLKGNKIKSVDAAAFQGNPSLVMLDLSHNDLLDLAPATFLSQLNLLLVDLSHNKIVRTPFGAFGRRVATVLLQGNPLVCVEQIHMLQQGNGVFIPNNNDDAICAKDKQQPTSAPVNPHGRTAEPEQPMVDLAEGALLAQEIGDQSRPAFVQQTQNRPQNSEFLTQSAEPEGGRTRTRMPNIKPIRIGGQPPQKTATTIIQPASSIERNGEISLPSSTMFLSSEETTKISPEIISTPPTPSILPENKNNKNQLSTLMSSAPIPISENISEGGRGIPKTEDNPTVSTTTGTVTSAADMVSLSTTVDPRNNPNVIYPHPVPFLSSGPKLHTAHNVNSAENDNKKHVMTLPPSIVMAAGGAGRNDQILLRPSNNNADEIGEIGNEITNRRENEHSNATNSEIRTEENLKRKSGEKYEQFELSTNHEVELKNSAEKFTEGKFDETDSGGRQRSIGKPLPGAVIVICMSTVGVVMLAVFVGMCVARKRQLLNHPHSHMAGSDLHSLQHSPNSNSYMSAAVAARAAQLNGLIYSGHSTLQRETLQRGGGTSRRASMNGGTMPMSRMPSVQDDIYGGWIYQPHGYNSYAAK